MSDRWMYCDNCHCNDCQIGRQKASERAATVNGAARQRARGSLAWMISEFGVPQQRINAVFQPNSTGWAGQVLKRVRREIDQATIAAFHDNSGSTQRLRRARALPTLIPMRSVLDVEIPEPGYRGEPNPSPPSADGGG